MDDKKEMQDTDAAFDILGFTQEEKIDLFKNTGSICYLGNTVFGQRGEIIKPAAAFCVSSPFKVSSVLTPC